MFQNFQTLTIEELIKWINELEYFECEDIQDPQRVQLAQTKLKGMHSYGGKRCTVRIIFGTK